MRTITMVGCVGGLLTLTAMANADDAATLIELDKQWGESQGSEELAPLLLDDVIQIGADGLGDKAGMLDEAESAEPPSGPYMASDYKVQFLSDDIAVMVHSTAPPEPHWSMHVWRRVNGEWKVAATASVPMEGD